MNREKKNINRETKLTYRRYLHFTCDGKIGLYKNPNSNKKSIYTLQFLYFNRKVSEFNFLLKFFQLQNLWGKMIVSVSILSDLIYSVVYYYRYLNTLDRVESMFLNEIFCFNYKPNILSFLKINTPLQCFIFFINLIRLWVPQSILKFSVIFPLTSA